MRSWALAVLLTASAACSSAVGPVRVGDEFHLHIGEAATFPDLGFQVRFISVTADNRCPIDVVCISAGDAGVLLETAPLFGDAKEDTLHTTIGPRTVSLGAIELELIRLEPERRAGRSITREQYVAVLKTTQAP